jgi:hypothetical protein
MKNKIFMIANTSDDYQLGAMLARAAKSLNIDLSVGETSVATYAPSMSNLFGKVFFKLAGKRPIEWWSWNQRIVNRIEEFQPDLVLVTGILPLTELLN